MLKHKTFFLIGLLSLVAVSLISCEESQDSGSSADVPAQFTCSSSSSESTRAYDETWETTDKVGIYMVSSSSNYNLSQALKANYQYQPSVDGTSVTLNPVDEIIFYPVNGSSVNFVAYSPYLSTATTANQAAYTFTNQNTKVTKEAVDFIFYKGENERSKTNATESMTFVHKFSKINITVTQGTNGPSCKDLIMRLTNVPQSATVNLATLALNEANVDALGVSAANTTITAYTSSSSATDATIEAIVAPHKGTGNFTGRTFTFSAGGYAYTLPDETTFEPGKAYTFNFTLTQTAAVLNEVNITNWEGGEVQWNKDYALTTSTGTVNLALTAQTVNIRYKGTTTTPAITPSTSATNTTTDPPDWFTTSLIEAPKEDDWNIQTLTVTPTAITSNVDRTGYIHISLKGLSIVVTVKQKLEGIYDATDGLSNCYIVYPGASINIPILRAWLHGGGASTSTYYASILWDDTSGLVVSKAEVAGLDNDQYIHIKTNSGKAGNALVAVREGSTTGTIRWSYHIWVTDYYPYQNTYTNAYTYNGHEYSFTFMDRNLGATFAGLGSGAGTGLFYQWGRKDPFPATGDGATIAADGAGTWYQTATSATNGTIANTIANPHIRYFNSIKPYNWLYSALDNELWGHSGGKSVYDPCPEGWQVPKNYNPDTGYASKETSPWKGMDGTAQWVTAANGGPGIIWAENAKYPANGNWEWRDNTHTTVGTDVVHSSAGAYDNAYCFYMGVSNNKYIWGGGFKSVATNIRCVKL